MLQICPPHCKEILPRIRKLKQIISDLEWEDKEVPNAYLSELKELQKYHNEGYLFYPLF